MKFNKLKVFVQKILEQEGHIKEQNLPQFLGEESDYEHFYISDDMYQILREETIENTGQDLSTSGFVFADQPPTEEPPETVDPEIDTLDEPIENEPELSSEGLLSPLKPARRDFIKKYGDEPISSLSPTQMEKARVVIRIPKRVVRETELAVLEAATLSDDFTHGVYRYAKEWYHELNQFIFVMHELERDSVLLASLFSILSPQTDLKDNMREALLLQRAMEIDVASGQNIQSFIHDPDFSSQSNLRVRYGKQGKKTWQQSGIFKAFLQAPELDEKYNGLSTFQMWKTNIRVPGTKWNNFKVVMDAYDKSDFSKETVFKLLTSDLDYKLPIKDIGKLKLSLDQRNFIGSTKVANFCLNVLFPEMARKNIDYLFNSTIDTWMIAIYYPGLKKFKSTLGGDPMSYLYVAGFVRRLAKKMNMLPHEVQAIIWTNIRMKSNASGASLGELQHFFNSQVEFRKETLDELKSYTTAAESIEAKARHLLASFNTIEDFKNVNMILSGG